MMTLKSIWELTKSALSDWQEDNAMRLGAALSYYTVFSLAPLLIIAIAVAGLVFGQDAARAQILVQVHSLIGDQGAAAIEEILKNASKPATGIIGTVVGLITLCVGATGVVGELHNALNTIWEVDAKPAGGFFGYVRQRIVSFAMVLAIGFLLLVSLVISAGLAAAGNLFGGSDTLFFQGLNFAASLIVITGVFALMFKYFPDVQISWRNVWVGAAITAILFTIGKTLTGVYLGRSTVASTFGAAGSLAVILVWVYYSSLILFFGAEFTQVYARQQGEQIVPDHKAQPAMATQQIEKEMNDDVNYVEDSKGMTEERYSVVYRTAQFSGYQKARLDHAFQPVKEKIKQKSTIIKWAYKIVKLIGLKTSAKLAWKGHEIKSRMDALKKEPLLRSETKQQEHDDFIR